MKPRPGSTRKSASTIATAHGFARSSESMVMSLLPAHEACLLSTNQATHPLPCHRLPQLPKTIHTERHRKLRDFLKGRRKAAGLTQTVVAGRLGKPPLPTGGRRGSATPKRHPRVHPTPIAN